MQINMLPAAFPVAVSLTDVAIWTVAALLVIVIMLTIGLGDLRRLILDGGYLRAWAISSVCFRESIRRRVLWMTPVAIVGVIVAVQLLNPIDDQDAIRQTIKYALFTTGTLVVLATIILACTNLPREIENRVIFTIVTKPTTRLEILLGKVIGFARVSATILLIMGLFTWGYAHFRASTLQSHITSRLDALSSTDPARPALEHYIQHGLLESKTYAHAAQYQEFARAPMPQDSIRWINGNIEQSIVVPFDLPPGLLPPNAQPDTNGGLRIDGKIEFEPYESLQGWDSNAASPTPFAGKPPDLDEFRKFRLGKAMPLPIVDFEILGPDRYTLIPGQDLSESGRSVLSVHRPARETSFVTIPAHPLDKLYKIPPEPALRIYVRMVGTGPFRYGMGPGWIRLYSPKLNQVIEPVKDADGKPAWPEFHGRDFMGNQQLKSGDEGEKLPVGVFSFRNVTLPASGPLAVELRTTIEGATDDNSTQDMPTHVIVDALNLNTGELTPVQRFSIESNRTAFFTLPVSALQGGNFDVHLRSIAPGRYLVLHTSGQTPSLQVVTDTEPFTLNLCKSLLVMWLMSLLVIVVSIFCSTFVSWPIAVVLTVVILLAHWGAVEIGDSGSSGLGASMARDLGFHDPATSKVFSSAVDSLNSFLNVISKVLPDISQFDATDAIERSISIPLKVLGESLKVILVFGVPLLVLGYVFFKRKEVAP